MNHGYLVIIIHCRQIPIIIIDTLLVIIIRGSLLSQSQLRKGIMTIVAYFLYNS